MVVGIESFKNWFKGYENQYAIIGGTACDILMSQEGRHFRATKDIDLVLIIEALNPDFGSKLWEYIKLGNYEHRNKSSGNPQFYRFINPQSPNFPKMIELFSRKTDYIKLPEDAVLTPLHIDENVSSLSAILLDDAYYNFLRSGTTIVNDITVLGPGYLIPFKMKAWLDLSNRKQKNENNIDSKNIKKHKNDVFRLADILTPNLKIGVSKEIYTDIELFIKKMEKEDVDLKQLDVVGRNKEDILTALKQMYFIN